MKPSRLFYLTIILLLVCISLVAAHYYIKLNRKPVDKQVFTDIDSEIGRKLSLFADSLKTFNLSGDYNSKTAFIIDMSLASGRNRFFIYDLETKTIGAAALVTHGKCNNVWMSGRKYSNEPGSGCTSTGKYKIGKSYYGKFGLAYKLHGLDNTNSNAFKRYVVLHAHDCVGDGEIHPYPLCQSDGCPTVSPAFLKKLQMIIDKSKKPVLLYITG